MSAQTFSVAVARVIGEGPVLHAVRGHWDQGVGLLCSKARPAASLLLVHEVAMARRFVSDVRYALRLVRRNPGFAAVAALVLALAIGVNTAAFGLVDALLFKSLPVRAPDELV